MAVVSTQQTHDLDAGARLVAEVRAMVPALRERARGAEEARRIPEATVKELIDMDLFKAVVPKRFGGFEIDYKYIPHIFRELARGCTSTSWAMGLLMYDNFQFAQFPDKAQHDVWGENRHSLAAGQVMPGGKAKKVDGGYILNGRWGYATGIQHSNWMLLSAVVENGMEKPDIHRFFVPTSEFEIIDTWDVCAMGATGSHDVTLKDVFVPVHRQMPLNLLRNAEGPGLALNPGPLWRIPLLVFMTFGAVGTLLGAAEAVSELTLEMLKNRIGAYSTNALSKQMSTRVRLTENMMHLEAIRTLFNDRIEWITEHFKNGNTLTREQRVELRAVSNHIARVSQYVANEMAREAGTRACTFNYMPIQRYQRDINSLATHALFDMDQTGDHYGGMLLGMEIPPEAMI